MPGVGLVGPVFGEGVAPGIGSAVVLRLSKGVPLDKGRHTYPITYSMPGSSPRHEAEVMICTVTFTLYE